MKKYSYMKLVVLLCMVFLTSPTYGFSLDTVVPFNGSNQPSGRFYHPFFKETKLVLGFSSTIPSSEEKELDIDLILGLNASIPAFGNVDIYGVFDKYILNDKKSVEGTNKTTTFRLEKLAVSKNWLYPINEYVNLGVQLVFGEMFLDGSKQWTVLPSFSPIIGVEILF